jgi:subtilisin family serine protease
MKRGRNSRGGIRSAAGVGLALALVAFLAPGVSEASANGGAVIGPGVREAIDAEGEALVLVALQRPERGSKEPPGHTVAAEVLERVGPPGLEIRRKFDHVSAFSAVVDARGLAKLARHPRVRRIDLDAPGQGFLVESGPLASFDQTQAIGLRGLGARIALLDSGVHGAHPDLGGAIVDRACFCSGGDGCCPNGEATQFGLGADQDDNGHGSNVAGVMISDGFVSPVGLSPDVELVSIKVLDHLALFCCSSDVIAGLDWLISNHPEVDAVNLSLGTNAIFPGHCDEATSFTMAFSEAISTLRSMGIPTVASSGNEGSGTSMAAPACIASAISVAAAWDAAVGPQVVFGCADTSTAADKITCYSNTGPTLDVVASGNPMTSTGLVANTSTFLGTSNASPLVTACIALLRGALPDLTPNQIEVALEASPIQLTDPTNGLAFPRVDCMEALTAAGFGADLPGAPLAWLAAALGSSGLLAFLALRKDR